MSSHILIIVVRCRHDEVSSSPNPASVSRIFFWRVRIPYTEVGAPDAELLSQLLG